MFIQIHSWCEPGANPSKHQAHPECDASPPQGTQGNSEMPVCLTACFLDKTAYVWAPHAQSQGRDSDARQAEARGCNVTQ